MIIHGKVTPTAWRVIIEKIRQAERRPQHVYPSILGYFGQYLIIYWLKNGFFHIGAVLDGDSHSHVGSTRGHQHPLYVSNQPFFQADMQCIVLENLSNIFFIVPREIFPAGCSIYQTFRILFRNNANVI